jgi:nucleoside phosphorylase
MKLLIVDDHARRYGRLVETLLRSGMHRGDIDIVGSAQQARDQMEKVPYDLLILDLLLPLWPEGDADTRHSLALLFELQETDQLHRPGRIIGITADLEVAKSAGPEFEKRTWTLIKYSPDNDEWMNSIGNSVEYMISNAKVSAPDYGVDIVIVCALATPELGEVLGLPWHWSDSPRWLDDTTYVRDGHFVLEGGRKVNVAATSAPRMGMVTTAILSAKLISLLRPRIIVMCGICAGVRNKVKLGDVLLADPAWDFQSGKRVKDEGNSSFSMAPHQLPVAAIVRTCVQQLQTDRSSLAAMSASFGSDIPGISQLIVGPVASGSAVLADGEVIQEIKAQHRELIGVEMEAYGLYAAAEAASTPKPKAFALKAVCDFADPDKVDGTQKYASFASANVLRLLMEKFGSRLLN